MRFVPQLFPEGEHFGLLAEYDSPGALVRACEHVRDAGYRKWDAHSPFPIHGIETAMGLGRSRLPYVALIFGLGGALGGMALQIWANAIAYPMVISGKPMFNWQPYVPITFECGVLLASLATVFGMFAFNKLPMLFHPLFGVEHFAKATDDGFFISVEAWDPKFDARATGELLSSTGARRVHLVRRREDAAP
ncbi:MAG: DUF3341 domain-containing protein [Deltaproteobacteria bacterium]|nr:DUF3341 domain-containing protein [Deltaproteobacteria bacterium]